MYEEKETVVLPFAADKKDAAVQCGVYSGIFAVLGIFLTWLMARKGYAPGEMVPVLAAYLLVALATWLPMALRCAAQVHLEPERVRVTVFGVTMRRYPLGKIRFVTAMECSGKNRTAARSQILLCAHTFEELAGKGGWKRGGRKPPEECARQYLNRYATAYYVRELNLTKDILWLDWAPDRIRLIRWLYPDAKWADFTQNHVFDKQMND